MKRTWKNAFFSKITKNVLNVRYSYGIQLFLVNFIDLSHIQWFIFLKSEVIIFHSNFLYRFYGRTMPIVWSTMPTRYWTMLVFCRIARVRTERVWRLSWSHWTTWMLQRIRQSPRYLHITKIIFGSWYHRHCHRCLNRNHCYRGCWTVIIGLVIFFILFI